MKTGGQNRKCRWEFALWVIFQANFVHLRDEPAEASRCLFSLVHT